MGTFCSNIAFYSCPCSGLASQLYVALASVLSIIFILHFILCITNGLLETGSYTHSHNSSTHNLQLHFSAYL